MKFKDRFKLWFKDFDIKLEVFLGLILKMPWKKLALVISIVLIGLGALIGVGYFLYWGLPKLGSLIWSGIITVFGWIGALLHFIVVDLWVMLWSLYWDAGFWSYLKTYVGDSGVTFLKGLSVVMLIGIITSFVIPLLTGMWSKRKTQPSTSPNSGNAEEDEIQRKSQSFFLRLLPWRTIPFQHECGLFWWWFGKSGYWRTIGEGVSFQIPLFNVATVVDRTTQDPVITTPQLPTGPIKTQAIEREKPSGSGMADRSAAKLEAKRKRAISGTLSYVLRMTATIRSGDGIKAILRAKPEYRNFRSPELLGRFTDIISARLKTAIGQLPFEDAFFIPEMVILLGNREELIGDATDATGQDLVGVNRWTRITHETAIPDGLEIPTTGLNPQGETETRDVNLFRINLENPQQVLAAITMRPDCLLRTLFDLGYKITNFSVKDVNPPTDLEAQLKQRVAAEIKRDAEYTRYISEHVDQAEAISAGRNIQSEASVYDYDVNLEALEKQFKKAHPKDEFNPTLQELIWLQNFREDRRTRRLMEGRVTVIDVGADSPIPASFAPFFASLAQGNKATQK